MPFIVGIFSDLSGTHPGVEKEPVKVRKFVEIDNAVFDDVMNTVAPGVQLTYLAPPVEAAGAAASAGDAPAADAAPAADGADAAAPAGAASTPAPAGKKQTAVLVFRKLDDFLPTEIVRRFAPLSSIFDTRIALRNIQSQIESNEEMEILFEAIVKDGDDGKKLRDAIVAAYPLGPAPAADKEPHLEELLKADWG